MKLGLNFYCACVNWNSWKESDSPRREIQRCYKTGQFLGLCTLLQACLYIRAVIKISVQTKYTLVNYYCSRTT